MSDLDSHEPAFGERHAGLFASLILQQSNMALMFLGKIPNPSTGKAETDLSSARVFIDLLEMLEIKTKGNLSAQENHMLKETLTGLRMAFVDTVNAEQAQTPQSSQAAPAAEPSQVPDASPPSEAASSDAGSGAATPQASPVDADSESKKKFTKKY